MRGCLKFKEKISAKGTQSWLIRTSSKSVQFSSTPTLFWPGLEVLNPDNGVYIEITCLGFHILDILFWMFFSRYRERFQKTLMENPKGILSANLLPPLSLRFPHVTWLPVISGTIHIQVDFQVRTFCCCYGFRRGCIWALKGKGWPEIDPLIALPRSSSQGGGVFSQSVKSDSYSLVTVITS